MKGTQMTPKGYQWKDLFLPNGTLCTFTYKGKQYMATVVDGIFQFKGKQSSPANFVNTVSKSVRNAWRDLWIKLPQSELFYPALELKSKRPKGERIQMEKQAELQPNSNVAVLEKPVPAGEGSVAVSKTSTETSLRKARDGQFFVQVHVEHELGNVNYTSHRVDTIHKAEAIAALARDTLVNMMETLVAPQQ